jgi:hypothetical protein
VASDHEGASSHRNDIHKESKRQPLAKITLLDAMAVLSREKVF